MSPPHADRTLYNAFDDPTRGAKSAAILALVGFVNVPIIKVSVDWWYTLHQPSSVVKVEGPYIISGGWWRSAVQREYHVAETQNGDMLWVFFDRQRRRWFLHGVVE